MLHRLSAIPSALRPSPWVAASSLALLLPFGAPSVGSSASGSTPAPDAATATSPAVIATAEGATAVNPAAPLQAVPAHYDLTPERRALLNTIRYAEGTWIGGRPEGYRVLYGGGRFRSLERHPEITIQKRYSSAAAGAYQFLPSTWHQTARQLGLPDFGPASQDQAALHLVQRRGALARFDREGLSPAVLARLSPEWASLPGLDGASAYGQPVKSVDELQAFFARDLARQRGDLARLGAATPGRA
ncbi:MAG: glycoside hydrolase family 104 protein [Synechococcaceae cyanobacterium]|nr:glycoside hydrolase family 104 protein [Synechococcaceae cyanobacterium]